MKGLMDLKNDMKRLRIALIALGVILFVLATVGESVERANWSAIGGYVDEIAAERGFASYAAIDDAEARESVRQAALVLAAQDTAAVNHGYKRFSKVKDEAEKELIRAEALEIAENDTGGGLGAALAGAWKPLLIASLVLLAAAAIISLAAWRAQPRTGRLFSKAHLRGFVSDQRVLLVFFIVLLVIVVGTINPKFVKLTNIIAIFQQTAVLGILTMSQCMLLISGGIDLSMGNMMALVGVLVATLLMGGTPLGLAVLAGMGVAVLCGLFNGIIIAKSHCIPLIITLGTGQIFYGISLLICGGSFLQFKGKLDFMRKIQLYNILPLMVIFMLAIVLLMFVLLNKTKFGRRIVAIGGNEKNAYLSGINVDLYKIITYAIGGLIVSVAALVLGARLDSITATAGNGYETDALVAAIIGGVTFEGGRGTVFGAFLGCLLTGIISNALDILGVHAYVKVVISGAIIVGAVVLSNIDNLRKKQ